MHMHGHIANDNANILQGNRGGGTRYRHASGECEAVSLSWFLPVGCVKME
jgi:hypothetical protein